MNDVSISLGRRFEAGYVWLGFRGMTFGVVTNVACDGWFFAFGIGLGPISFYFGEHE